MRIIIPLLLLSQALHGQLQLLGYYPSNHGWFPVTGLFNNPGPYAGFLVSLLPFVVYVLLNSKKEIVKRKSEFLIIKKEKLKSKDNKQRQKLKSFNNNLNFTFYNLLFKFRNLGFKFYNLLFNYYLSVAAVVLSLLVLPAARSRAAWLAALLSIGLLLFNRYKQNIIYNLRKKYLRTKLVFISVSLFCLVLVSVSAFALYQYKKASADGRVLIWEVSAKIIQKNPIFGNGVGSFKRDYMATQAEYFKEHPTSEYASLADDNLYAFNEYIKLTVEKGFLGLLVLLVVLGFLLFYSLKHLNQTDKNMVKATRYSLLALMVFAFFSYPLSIVEFQLLGAFYLLVLCYYFLKSQSTKFGWSLNNLNYIKNRQRVCFIPKKSFLCLSNYIILFIVLFPIGFVVYGEYKCHQLHKEAWDSALYIYNCGDYEGSIELYEEELDYFKEDGEFLVNYGKALCMAQKYEKAVEVLENAKNYFSNTILYNALGDSYKALKKYPKAEEAYLTAKYMTPVKFYPIYLLAKLYNESGQKEKALKTADELLNKKIKVPSTAIEEMKKEVEGMIEKRKK
jgi:tetratricopeptide (TPR) repeat protein